MMLKYVCVRQQNYYDTTHETTTTLPMMHFVQVETNYDFWSADQNINPFIMLV